MPPLDACDNPGWALEHGLAWVEAGGDDKPERRRLLDSVQGIAAADCYLAFYRRAKPAAAAAIVRLFEVAPGGRLLVGAGSRSVLEVGLTLQRPYGLPLIPGSSLKGLARRTLWRRFGGESRGAAAGARTEYRKGGAVDRALFGGLDEAGLLLFHDALYDPGSVQGRPFCSDILTPHHAEYYTAGGNEPAPPADWDDPQPTSFLAVKPGARFRVAVAARVDEPATRTWLAWAMDELLVPALGGEGVGAKTAAGYGRLAPVPER